jgi:hypothetical protein
MQVKKQEAKESPQRNIHILFLRDDHDLELKA